MTREHDIRIEVEGQQLRPPISYSIDVDLLQPADAMSITMPLDRRSWDSCPLDGQYRVFIDDTPVVSGFVDSKLDNGDSFTVQGRDRTGRLVDESVPGAGLTIRDKLLSQAVLEIVRPWYSAVTFSNAEDRRLRRGRGRKVHASREPALSAQQWRAVPRRIDAGTSRQEALERILEPLQLLSWGAADGETLVIARPHFRQAPQYSFIGHPERSNVKSLTLSASTQGRYRTIEVSGSGRPPGVPVAPVAPGQQRFKYVNRNRIGVATDDSDFLYDKRLFIISEMRSTDEAQHLAERTMRQGMAQARTASVIVPGHGQCVEGSPHTTLYTVDTVAHVEKWIETAPGDDTPTVLVRNNMYVTRVTYTGDRNNESTELALSPLDVELA